MENIIGIIFFFLGLKIFFEESYMAGIDFSPKDFIDFRNSFFPLNIGPFISIFTIFFYVGKNFLPFVKENFYFWIIIFINRK